MTTATYGTCPSCMKHALGKHCANRHCPWRKCLAKNGGCEAVLNLARKRGYRWDRATNEFVHINLGGL
jgi:hypothetical protein